MLKPLILFLITIATCTHFAGAAPVDHDQPTWPMVPVNQLQAAPLPVKIKPGTAFAGNCYDINWATWSSFSNVSSTTGAITDADGTQIGITMSANYNFDSTPSIYTFSKFSGYPSAIPNSTVPKTTWNIGPGGSTTMCFSRKVTNPVLLLSSLGSSAPISSRLDFSIPYVVLYDGGGMVYNSSTAITGTEGYAIIMFPGDFTCVTINSNTGENYTNLTWGIRPQPFAINVADGPAVCGSTTVTASGGIVYKWDGGDTPNLATNTFHQSGTYLVTVTNANGCVTSASKAVSVSTVLNPVITGTTTACSSVTLIASGGTTYLWDGGSNPTSATNVFTSSGTYSVTVTTASGCTSTVSQNVTVLPAPVAAISGNTSACNSVTLTASGGGTYLWSGGSNPTSATNVFTTSGVYTVTVTNANGCTAIASANVTILDPVIIITGSTTGCTGVTITAGGGNTYLWNGGSSPNSATNTFTTSGAYTVTVTNAAGCTATATANVNISLPVAAISGNLTDCGYVILTASGGVSYQWDGGDSPNSAVNNFTTSGNYSVIVTNANGCTNTTSALVTINPVPTVILPQNIAITDDTPVQVVPVITGNIISYIWSPTDGMSDPAISNPFINPATTTKYTLTVITTDGCPASADLTVTVKRNIFVPNTFTPNGDGVNDTWNVKNLSDYENAEVFIFTRWGQKVYYSKGYSIPWNGTYEGKKLAAGVYYYLIVIDDISPRQSGPLTIIY